MNDDVTPSSSRLFWQSTKRPIWERKSTPMMRCVTPATTNRHVKFRRRPKLRVGGSYTYVWMVVPLAAQRSQLARSLRLGTSLLGHTQMSEPLSTRNCRLLDLSAMKRRPVIAEQTCAAGYVCCVSLPAGGRRRVEYTSALLPRNGDGTSRG
jgi:hypothetical protein